jgi:hypothetical protein
LLPRAWLDVVARTSALYGSRRWILGRKGSSNEQEDAHKFIALARKELGVKAVLKELSL